MESKMKRSKWDLGDRKTRPKKTKRERVVEKVGEREAEEVGKEKHNKEANSEGIKPEELSSEEINAEETNSEELIEINLLPSVQPRRIEACRSVENYDRLNHIEEGSYGIVVRARDKATGELVALKKLKTDRNPNGFLITSLREIHALSELRHDNIVNLREVVVGGPQEIYLVMDFIEHDLKGLMENMKEPFVQSEVKTLLSQLLTATEFMHHNWILHRDLKTSNLLLNNRGMIKVADFGLATSFGSDMPLTQLVVTLWYRAPELLLNTKNYGPAVDMWSIGCIFAELLLHEPFLQGRSEIDQFHLILRNVDIPSDDSWPGYRKLPLAKQFKSKIATSIPFETQFPHLSSYGLDLLKKLLTLDPSKRISASEALKHPYFKQDPQAKRTDMFPSFPSKGGLERRRTSPGAPIAMHGGFDLDENAHR